MNINDDDVLEILNKIIASERLTISQILHMVKLVSVSNDFNDLKENLRWEKSIENINKI
tara:strand:+ start:77 stop:253 length:177 start_codon:yes stop_codon:yes gene_type:complete